MRKTLCALAIFVATSVAATDFNTVERAIEDKDLTLAQTSFSQLNDELKNQVKGQVLQGRLLLLDKKNEDAYDYLEEVRENYPDDVDVNYYFGLSAVMMAQEASIFSKLGYAKDFISAMEKTVNLQPEHVEALDILIGFHLNAPSIAGGDKDQALVYANQLFKVDEEKGFGQLANVYYQTDQQTRAHEIMAEAIAKYPESSSLYFSRGVVFINEEDWQAAMADLQNAAKYAQDDEEKGKALYQVGKVAAESGEDIEQGIKALTEAKPFADKGYTQWINLRLAQLHTHNKAYQQAQVLLEQVDVKENERLEKEVKKLKKRLKKLVS